MFNPKRSDLDYFPGGVPAGAIFQMNIDNLRKIVVAPDIRAEEVCLVGLVAYFEAFFKDHFASIINIQPHLAENLKKGDYDTRVDVSDIVSLGSNSEIRLGSLLAENFDFGTAKRINSIYQTLLMVTPFSKDEIVRYDQLLNDRNLIVHHGGIYTLRYVKQSLGDKLKVENAYFDSLVITNETFIEALSFCEAIVTKTTSSTKQSLQSYINKNTIHQSDENERAWSMLDLWFEEDDFADSDDDFEENTAA